MIEDIQKTLWATADKLRANMDAAEYKHLVLGLIFLKYVADTFAARRAEVQARLQNQADEFYFADATGRAGIVLANGSMSSSQNNEGVIRAAMVDADVVEVMVALPGQLFFNTQIPACLWFLAKQKKRKGEVLFIDARKQAKMISRVQAELDDAAIQRIADTVAAWRGEVEAGSTVTEYQDQPGFCRSVPLVEIAQHGHVLTPGHYVGAEAVEDDEEAFDDKMRKLTEKLGEQMAKGAELDALIRAKLGGWGMSSEQALPQGWHWSTLDEVRAQGKSVVSGPFGSNIGSRFFVSSGVPVIRGSNLTTGMERFREHEFVFLTPEKATEFATCEAVSDDLIFTAAGTIGQVGLIPKRSKYPKYIISNKQLRARLDTTKIDPEFAFYWFASPAMVQTIQSRNTGSTIPLINLSVLKSLPLPVPPLEEQREIAVYLSTLDDRITLLRETNATLEAIAQALFKSWFVDFDPVLAKMEGHAPEGMDEVTAALFPDSFEETALGVVPKGWRVGTLASVALLNAQSLSPRNPPSEIHYIDLAGVKANVFDVPQCYSFADAPSRARRVLQEGDCIVGTVRPGNRSFGFIVTAQNHLIGSTGFAVLSPKQHRMTAFTYLCATRDESIDRLASLADGGAYPAVRPDVVASTPCTLPPDEVMKVFEGAARPLLDAIGANGEQTQTLSTLRDTLLPRLISGQLRVPEATGQVHA